jgi:hypothetical protein
MKTGRARGSNVDTADTNPGPPKRAAAVSKKALRGGLVLQVRTIRQPHPGATVQNCTVSKINQRTPMTEDDRAAAMDCAIVNRLPRLSVENGS